VKLAVRKPDEVVSDVATWTARLEGIVGGATRSEVEYLAGQVTLFSLALEAVERAVLQRRAERQERESRALGLALKGDAARDSKGPERQPGALHQHSHTGPYPVGDIRAPRNYGSREPSAS
jgi:hypothetical protein